jgi:hypothetical protein
MCVLYYTNSFDGSPIANGTGYIYVPGALHNSYLADTKWSTYANQFRRLEDYTVDGTINGELDTSRHMVRFFDEDGTLLGYDVVAHGGTAVYDGDEPTKGDDYAFTGWKPSNANITADTDCYAQFRSTKSVARAILSRKIEEYSNDSITEIGAHVFRYCDQLKSIDLPNVTLIGKRAFAQCKALTNVYLPNVIELKTSTFEQCYGLLNIDLPNVTTIGSSVFTNCSYLQSVNIPKVTNISSSGFSGCSRATSIHLPAVPPTIASNTFSSLNSKCVFYIPTGALAAYQSATYWSTLTTNYSFVEEDR